MRFVIKGSPRSAVTPGTEATPGTLEEQNLETPTDGGPPLTINGEAPLTADDDPALRVKGTRSAGAATSAPIGVEPDYPTSPEVDVSAAQPQEEEVIHEGQGDTAPADGGGYTSGP